MDCDDFSIDELLKRILSDIGGEAAAAVDAVLKAFSVEDKCVLILLALSVKGHSSGNTCLDLGSAAKSPFLKSRIESTLPNIDLPPPSEMVRRLRALPLVVDCEPNVFCPLELHVVPQPLVLLNGVLFTRRQFVDEASIARELVARSNQEKIPVSEESCDLLEAVLPVVHMNPDGSSFAQPDSVQNDVGKAILDSRLVVLTGGPGTGKTFTMIRLIALALASGGSEASKMEIAVCAPTGKAASRAGEELSKFVKEERARPANQKIFNDAVLEKIDALRPVTIHRLLGKKGGSHTRFKFDRDNKLRLQLIAVDEASMVPSQLMARFLEACDVQCQVLLVGDEAQLESVESGSVLSGVVDSKDLLQGVIHKLNISHRAGGDGPLPRVAKLIQNGDDALALTEIKAGGSQLMMFPARFGPGDVDSVLEGVVAPLERARILASSTDATSHVEALKLSGSIKVLCGPRENADGRGVRFWDDEISHRVLGPGAGVLVPGRPLLVLENSAATSLSNGDVGLVVETGEGLRVAFPDSDEAPKYFPPAALPPHMSCYAMTVHKSQGSEYTGYVVVVLPHLKSPLLVRELIYTAITRAKKSAVVKVVGSEEEFLKAVRSDSRRSSGLTELIRLATK